MMGLKSGERILLYGQREGLKLESTLLESTLKGIGKKVQTGLERRQKGTEMV